MTIQIPQLAQIAGRDPVLYEILRQLADAIPSPCARLIGQCFNSNSGTDYITASTVLVDVDGARLAFQTIIPKAFDLLVLVNIAAFRADTVGNQHQVALVRSRSQGVAGIGIAHVFAGAAANTINYSGHMHAVIRGDGEPHHIRLQHAVNGGNGRIFNGSPVGVIMSFFLVPKA